MTTRNLDDSELTPDHGYLQWRDANRTQQVEIGEFLTLGREASSHLPIDDEFASARHARIERKLNGFLLRDLRSRNGTLLNGGRIVEAWLNDGDRIRIGQTELLFTRHRDQAPTYLLTSKNIFWQAQLDRLPNVARSSFPVLLTGPSGTGKEVLAETLHRLSTRKGGPFVSVNCSALSESLVESELFGHLKGSFTGATSDRKGAFEAARGGTLFLDEIGDLPLSLQPKLLRALENNQIRPVGSDRSCQTDVRILAATHHNLKRLVQEEKFRADLYFRLHVVQIHAPALKDRMEDFEDLLYNFGRAMRVGFNFNAVQRLKAYDWPGNIRELRNVVARAKAYWGNGEVTDLHINQLLDQTPRTSEKKEEETRPPKPVIKEIECEMIKNRLIANHGNQRKTAVELGIPKSTLHDRLRAYGINVRELMRNADS